MEQGREKEPYWNGLKLSLLVFTIFLKHRYVCVHACVCTHYVCIYM